MLPLATAHIAYLWQRHTQGDGGFKPSSLLIRCISDQNKQAPSLLSY